MLSKIGWLSPPIPASLIHLLHCRICMQDILLQRLFWLQTLSYHSYRRKDILFLQYHVIESVLVDSIVHAVVAPRRPRSFRLGLSASLNPQASDFSSRSVGLSAHDGLFPCCYGYLS